MSVYMEEVIIDTVEGIIAELDLDGDSFNKVSNWVCSQCVSLEELTDHPHMASQYQAAHQEVA